MSFPYPELEPGSWESIYDAQAPECSYCGRSKRGAQCVCELPEVVHPKIVRDWQPAAVVFPQRHLTMPETIWFDATWPHTRHLAVNHARALGRATRGLVTVL